MFGRLRTRRFTALALASLYLCINVSVHRFHTCRLREEPVHCDEDASGHREHIRGPLFSADPSGHTSVDSDECAACVYLKTARSGLPAATCVIDFASPLRVSPGPRSTRQAKFPGTAYSIRAPPFTS